MERILSGENMHSAWKQVKGNKGTPGANEMTIEEMSEYLREQWTGIRESLMEGNYQPSPVLRVEIPKPTGGVRVLGIPTVLDRLIQQAGFDTIRMCFFVPGHAKNDADRLFARISHAFHKNDVFITEHLVTLIRNTIKPAGSCTLINNHDIVNWKELLGKKYSSFISITNYRDFLIRRNSHGKVVVYYKARCYHGDYAMKNLLKEGIDAGLDLKKDMSKFTYDVKGLSPNLSEDKITDLVKMYDKFIEPVLRPKWLPVSVQIKTSHMTASSPSSELARQHRMELKKKKRNRGKNDETVCT
ncbi:MAG: hypothetical protein GY801_28910 [bacterium]|nr:hypothetical protein [bacterium]